MGNLCWQPQQNNVVQCIQEMQKVEKTLSLLIDKYEKQIKQQRNFARHKLYNKDECIVHVKTIMVIKYHKTKLEERLTSCLNKRYHLESLNVTKMHIEAVRMTSKTFSSFLKEHDIQRIEQLKDSLTDMIDDACDINDTLNRNSGPYQADDDEIEEEYRKMQLQIQLPIAPDNQPSGWTRLEIDLSEEAVAEEAHQPLMQTA